MLKLVTESATKVIGDRIRYGNIAVFLNHFFSLHYYFSLHENRIIQAKSKVRREKRITFK